MQTQMKLEEYCLLVSSLSYASTLKMKAIYSSVTSGDFQQTTGRYTPEDTTLQNHRCQNSKSYRWIVSSSFHPVCFRCILILLNFHLCRGNAGCLFRSDYPTRMLYLSVTSPVGSPCHPHTSHSPWCDDSEDNWWRVQVMKLFTMQFSPVFWYFSPRRRKYSLSAVLSSTSICVCYVADKPHTHTKPQITRHLNLTYLDSRRQNYQNCMVATPHPQFN
jgi:hypothetical protein